MAVFCGVTSAGMFLGNRAGEAMERCGPADDYDSRSQA
jgi:hypothetical protein